MSFNILFDATVLGIVDNERTRRGIYFVVANILKELIKKKEIKIFLYYHPDFPNAEINIKKNLKGILGNDDVLPIVNKNISIFQQDDIHVVLNLWCWSPEFLKNINVKKYIFLYDCLPFLMPGYQYFLNPGEWFERVISNLNKDDFYFTDSNHARKDFIKLCPEILDQKISTIYLAASNSFRCQNSTKNKKYICQKYKIPGDYIFALCSLEPRKNIIMNIQSFIEFIKKHKISNLYFVLGGGKWDDFIKIIDKKIKDLKEYKKYIIRAGYIPDEDLPLLYSNAQWSVYTSLYEGFGLPALEAMSCGCPIIASNTTSLPEVVENAGILINPNSLEEHILAYEKYYYDSKFWKDMKEKALLQAKKFSWKKTTDQILDTIKSQYKGTEYISVYEIRQKIISYCLGKEHSTLLPSAKQTKEYYLWKFIPILSVKEMPQKKKIYLLKIIPIIKIYKKGNVKRCKLFNLIPILKIESSSQRTKYTFLYFLRFYLFSNKKNKLPINKDISFNSELPFDIEGVSDLEPFGRWSQGYTTTMYLSLPQKCIAKFRVTPLINILHPNLDVDIQINSKTIECWHFSINKPNPSTEIELPKSDYLELKFIYHQPATPKDCKINDDTRLLALAFQSLWLSPSTKNKKSYSIVDNTYIKQISIFGFPVYRQIKKEIPSMIRFILDEETNELRSKSFVKTEDNKLLLKENYGYLHFFNYGNDLIQFNFEYLQPKRNSSTVIKIYVNGKKIHRLETKKDIKNKICIIPIRKYAYNKIKFYIINHDTNIEHNLYIKKTKFIEGKKNV